MNARARKTWGVFAACLAVVGFLLFWLNREVLDLQRRASKASDDAHVQEAMRLALWRMDSAFAPVLAQEALKASATFSELAAANAFQQLQADLPAETFQLHFAVDAEGQTTRPELAPYAGWLKEELPKRQLEQKGGGGDAGGKKLEDEKLGDARERDERAAASRPSGLPRDTFVVRPPPPPMPSAAARADAREKPEAPAATPAPDPAGPEPQQRVSAPQVEQSKDEYVSRAKMAQRMQSAISNSNVRQTLESEKAATDKLDGYSLAGTLGLTTETGPYEARWYPGPAGRQELFLVRKVRNTITGQETLQGIWCDWPKLERWLVSTTRDLFADARLEPAPRPTESDQASMMATIPARLVPGAMIRTWETPPSPTRLVLWVAWIAAIGAIVAVGGVLKAALSLGERRGRFVSAVTHELRTPLTTFRMYSQMLADGMVSPEARPEYIATLRDESERLTRVVESVLLYSRLEEGRGGAHRERIAARAVVDRILPPVSKRAADGGMSLATVIEVDPAAAVELDVQAVEQIVLNLVDNACKYAAPESDRLELGFRTARGLLRISCRDWGPGIPDREREAVFLPFRRGEKDAAGTTPGVGLGLALARGLARALGGDLVLDPRRDAGAAFELTIPLVRAV